MRGQSLAELALILPVLLLLVLFAIDFGRIYLGYINLQQMARVAGNFAAEHASAWRTPQDADVLARYQDMIRGDATTINCDLVAPGGALPDPVFLDGDFNLGHRVEVRINCRYPILTPIISSVIGSPIDLGASVIYPIREGAIAEVPGGGGPILLAPNAAFLATPRSGHEPLDVTLTDLSDGLPTTWRWDFGRGGSDTSFDQGPHTITYTCPDTYGPGESCTFTVTLEVGSLGGFDTATQSIEVYVPPDTGPVAEFLGSPLAGVAPVDVSFCAGDLGMTACPGGGTYAYYEWDFGDGTGDEGATLWTVPHTYTDAATYDVSLQVTDAAGLKHQLEKIAYVVVERKICEVPDFAGRKKTDAQASWDAAGFTTTVQFQDGHGNYTISYQSLLGGLSDPQPNGCDSVITVGP